MNPDSAALFPGLIPLTADIGTALLCALLVTAALIDYRTLRVPNWLTVGGMVIGLACSALLPRPSLMGFVGALGGLGVALAILLPLYALKAMGAGDVKLMAMVGSFLGLPGTLYAVLFTFIAGGVAALLFAVCTGRLTRLYFNVGHALRMPAARIEEAVSVGRLPYAVCIAVGTIGFIVIKRLGSA